MTRHISTNVSSRFAQRFFTFAKAFTINTTLVELYVNIRTALWGIFFGVLRHRIDTNQPVHISWLKLLVSVINEISCMKQITRAEQIGLTWPGTLTRRARSILQQP